MDVDYGKTHMGLHIYFNYDDSESVIMKTIGDRIRVRRKELKLTQPQLAAQVELDQSTISDIERGAGFSAHTLMRFARSLHTTPEYIMRGGAVEDINGAEIASIYRALDETQQAMLITMARSLVANESKAAKPRKERKTA